MLAVGVPDAARGKQAGRPTLRARYRTYRRKPPSILGWLFQMR